MDIGHRGVEQHLPVLYVKLLQHFTCLFEVRL